MGEPVYYFPLPEGVLTVLRVHGVSGPDPAAVLETPEVFHVAQQSDVECDRTALVTYGCQYSYLFARGFPAYLGGQVLDRLADRMAVGKAPGRWLNLYRFTDYLGSHVQLSDRFPDINREVADPSYARLLPPPEQAPVPVRCSLQRPGPRDMPGDLITSTSPLRHSDYPASYEYHQAVLQLDATIPPLLT